jgi:hypothetical protein
MASLATAWPSYEARWLSRNGPLYTRERPVFGGERVNGPGASDGCGVAATLRPSTARTSAGRVLCIVIRRASHSVATYSAKSSRARDRARSALS